MIKNNETNFLHRFSYIVGIILAVVTVGGVTFSIVDSKANESRDLSKKELISFQALSDAKYYPMVIGIETRTEVLALQKSFSEHIKLQAIRNEKLDEKLTEFITTQMLILQELKNFNSVYRFEDGKKGK